MNLYIFLGITDDGLETARAVFADGVAEAIEAVELIPFTDDPDDWPGVTRPDALDAVAKFYDCDVTDALDSFGVCANGILDEYGAWFCIEIDLEGEVKLKSAMMTIHGPTASPLPRPYRVTINGNS